MTLELTQEEAQFLRKLCVLSQGIGRRMTASNHPQAIEAARADVVASEVIEKINVAELKSAWQQKMNGLPPVD